MPRYPEASSDLHNKITNSTVVSRGSSLYGNDTSYDDDMLIITVYYYLFICSRLSTIIGYFDKYRFSYPITRQ